MLFEKHHLLDDVDVESCLANLDRVEEVGSPRVVVDLRVPTGDDEDLILTDA